jgi:hypothetical protein
MDGVFISANFEGNYNYIRFNGVWYSVNGTPNHLLQIRWKVTSSAAINKLNELADQQRFREMLSD